MSSPSVGIRFCFTLERTYPHEALVTCPICSKAVASPLINEHIDNACQLPSEPGPTRASPKHIKNLAPIFSPAPGASSSRASSKQDTSGHKRQRPSNDDGNDNADPRPSKRAHFDAVMPLAAALRPTSMCDFVGQTQVMSLLPGLSNQSLIFWGPPGYVIHSVVYNMDCNLHPYSCGKTTLSRLMAEKNGAVFKEVSATFATVNDVRTIFEEAKRLLALTGRRTTLFMDEIHRFNKAQQVCHRPSRWALLMWF